MKSRGLQLTLVGAVVGAVIAGVITYAIVQRTSPATSGGDYLALGDSVTFGYREVNTLPPPIYTDPASFIGFPEDVGAALGLTVTNIACRGETSQQLISANVASLSCPLHVAYTGTQLDYATSFLSSHPHTKLVTLMIGVNDVLTCQVQSTDNCDSRLPQILTQLSSNITATLRQLRAHYSGTIVLVTYYPLLYLGVDHAAAVNSAVTEAAAAFHVSVANGWSAFVAAAKGAGENVCAAGLLTQLVGGGCGIHPSVSGQSLLALAVEEAVQSYTAPVATQPSSCPRGQRRLPDGNCVAG